MRPNGGGSTVLLRNLSRRAILSSKNRLGIVLSSGLSRKLMNLSELFNTYHWLLSARLKPTWSGVRPTPSSTWKTALVIYHNSKGSNYWTKLSAQNSFETHKTRSSLLKLKIRGRPLLLSTKSRPRFSLSQQVQFLLPRYGTLLFDWSTSDFLCEYPSFWQTQDLLILGINSLPSHQFQI